MCRLQGRSISRKKSTAPATGPLPAHYSVFICTVLSARDAIKMWQSLVMHAHCLHFLSNICFSELLLHLWPPWTVICTQYHMTIPTILSPRLVRYTAPIMLYKTTLFNCTYKACDMYAQSVCVCVPVHEWSSLCSCFLYGHVWLYYFDKLSRWFLPCDWRQQVVRVGAVAQRVIFLLEIATCF